MSDFLRHCSGCGDIWEVRSLSDDYLCPRCLGDIDHYLEREPT